VTTYTIGEIASRSGFSASALRYYEGIGLVSPAARTDAGYRLYDDQALARLAFIDRAKRLGCSLEEITDLVGIWDGERCGTVQRRFHELVTTKVAEARRHVAELAAFTAQLQAAAAHLSGEPVDGPCGAGCACLTATPQRANPVRVSLATPGDPPIVCTLDAGSMSARLAQWQSILARATARTTTPEGALRVAFDDDIDLGELAGLVAAEQHCCAFFSFAITVDGRGVALEVRAPEGASEIVFSLFGQPV
jgi:DNA-binding transcriptional MerR regulator